MQTAETARYKVLQLKQLPPLSSTASQLISLLADEDLEIEDLARVIEQDPPLTARILGLANAAFYGQSQPLYRVDEAIIRVLGLKMVKSLALSLAVSGVFDASHCRGFKLDEYWGQAFGGAMLARSLALQMDVSRRPDPDGVYLCGLLLSLGVLVIVHLFPEAYARVLREMEKEPAPNVEPLEQSLVGINRWEAGEWLTDRWQLPEMVVRVIASQQGMVYSDEMLTAARLVRASADWVKDNLTDAGEALSENPVLSRELGIATDRLAVAETEFLKLKEEIRTIARLLAK